MIKNIISISFFFWSCFKMFYDVGTLLEDEERQKKMFENAQTSCFLNTKKIIMPVETDSLLLNISLFPLLEQHINLIWTSKN